MSEEEESKKTEFARIQPIKVQKAMTAEEIEAHKKQLEDYYSGKNVAEIEPVMEQVQVPKKTSKVRIFLLVLVFIFFWLGVFFSYFLSLN